MNVGGIIIGNKTRELSMARSCPIPDNVQVNRCSSQLPPHSLSVPALTEGDDNHQGIHFHAHEPILYTGDGVHGPAHCTL